jgi:hypothetical protein
MSAVIIFLALIVFGLLLEIGQYGRYRRESRSDDDSIVDKALDFIGRKYAGMRRGMIEGVEATEHHLIDIAEKYGAWRADEDAAEDAVDDEYVSDVPSSATDDVREELESEHGADEYSSGGADAEASATATVTGGTEGTVGGTEESSAGTGGEDEYSDGDAGGDEYSGGGAGDGDDYDEGGSDDDGSGLDFGHGTMLQDAEGRFLGRKDVVELSRDDEGNIVGYNPNTDTERVVAYAEDVADERSVEEAAEEAADDSYEEDLSAGEREVQETGEDVDSAEEYAAEMHGSESPDESYTSDTDTGTNGDTGDELTEGERQVQEAGDDVSSAEEYVAEVHEGDGTSSSSDDGGSGGESGHAGGGIFDTLREGYQSATSRLSGFLGGEEESEGSEGSGGLSYGHATVLQDAEGRFLGRKDEVELSRDDEGNIVGYNPRTDEERVVARAEDIHTEDDENALDYGHATMLQDAEGRFLGRKDEVELGRDDEGNIVGYNPNTEEERVVAYAEDVDEEEIQTEWGSLQAQTGDDESSYDEGEQGTFRDFGGKEEGQRELEEYEMKMAGGTAGLKKEYEEAADKLKESSDDRKERQEEREELLDEYSDQAAGHVKLDEETYEDSAPEEQQIGSPSDFVAYAERVRKGEESGDALAQNRDYVIKSIQDSDMSKEEKAQALQEVHDMYQNAAEGSEDPSAAAGSYSDEVDHLESMLEKIENGEYETS